MSFSRPNSSAHQATLRAHPGTQSDSALMEHGESRLLQQTFRMLPEVISIYDVDMQQVVYSNRTLDSMLGYEDDSIPHEWLLHPADVATVNAQFEQMLQTRDDDYVDVSYRLKDAKGKWKWFAERQVIFKRHNDGSVAQILKTTRDSQEPHLTTSDLLHHITQYNLPNFAFMMFDRNLRFTVATGILLRRMGISTEAMEGHQLNEVMQPDIVDWLEPAFQAALAGAEIHLEQVVGGIIVSIYCLPIRNENGEITAGMLLAEDVTDEKQATAALVESEQRFVQFSENMQAMFWMIDTDRKKPLYFSPAFNDICQLTPEIAYENPVLLLDIVHPDDRQMVIDIFTETFITGRHEMKFRIVLPDGKFRWLASRAFPIYDDAGGLYRVAGIADDITQQMDVEKISFDLALEREHMRLLSQFISTTSHELRTPLTIINTSLYLIKKMNDPTKQADRLQIIEHQVAQLARLISQMHMLLRIESITEVNSAIPVSLTKMLTKINEDYAPAIAKKEIKLEMAFGEDVPPIDVDPDLLLVVLQNVFENAINYTDAGSIKVQTATQDNEVILTVADTGIGIDAEDLPHIFERFYKVEKNKRRGTVAAGLGLAITRRIMDLSGGRVEVESQVDHGSIFRLIWPLKS